MPCCPQVSECWAQLRPHLDSWLWFLHSKKDREGLEPVPRGSELGMGLEHESDKEQLRMLQERSLRGKLFTLYSL